MNRVVQHYRCLERHVPLDIRGPLSENSGYFKFGADATCYGRCAGHSPSRFPQEPLPDVFSGVEISGGTVHLPFDLEQVVDNLRYERYVYEAGSAAKTGLVASAYYLIRPLLPVSVRKHLQEWHLRGWDRLPFPHWPVDRSVEEIFGQTLLQCLQARQGEKIPFIWFWPEGASSCAIMTHDVETEMGLRSCSYLMDAADEYGMKSSFQVIPEQRYKVDFEVLDSMRRRGFEIAVHDLNHDGRLFRDKEEFLRRAAKINSYKQSFGATGFRAGVLYRRQDWFNALDFSYDMSVPNVAHLDPQRGGCCTVMPYFVGEIVEIPVTATQDYTLFNILHDYSIDLWKTQINLIMESHGLISFIVHPDYVGGARERAVYESLLAHLAELKRDQGIWLATPGEVDRWWRMREKMNLLEDESGWHIEGPGSEQACIAYARQENGRLVYKVSSTPAEVSVQTHEVRG